MELRMWVHWKGWNVTFFSVAILLQEKIVNREFHLLSRVRNPLKPQEDILQPTHHPLILKLTLRKNRKRRCGTFCCLALCLPCQHPLSPDKHDLKCEPICPASHLKIHNVWSFFSWLILSKTKYSNKETFVSTQTIDFKCF